MKPTRNALGNYKKNKVIKHNIYTLIDYVTKMNHYYWLCSYDSKVGNGTSAYVTESDKKGFIVQKIQTNPSFWTDSSWKLYTRSTIIVLAN